MWAELFSEERGGGRPPEGLERQLTDALQRGEQTWRNARVDRETFVRYLARRAPAGPSRLDGLQLAHLYLACGCAGGDPGAIAALEAEFFPRLERALARFRNRLSLDDLRQHLRETLLVAAPGREPKIAAYGGRGDLGRWLAAVAVRAAIDALRRTRPPDDAAEADPLEELALPGDDAEQLYLKSRYGPDFKAALREAIAQLTAQQRTELRQYYAEGLSVVDLGRLYHLAPSSVSRHLAASRKAILEHTRSALAKRLGIPPREVDSLVQAIKTRLELSRSLFGPG